MTNESIKLAKLWIDLSEIKKRLDNEILPISGHLGIEDPNLMIAMEALSEKIANHFDRFRLTAVTKKEQQLRRQAMIKLTKENTKWAIERCKQLKPKVRFIKDRLFVVYSANNSNVYHVSFDVINGDKFGVCECAAAEKGLVCYHIVAGATANIYRQSLKLAK